MNSNLVIEEIPEDVENYKEIVQIADENKIKVALVMYSQTTKLDRQSKTQTRILIGRQLLIIHPSSYHLKHKP